MKENTTILFLVGLIMYSLLTSCIEPVSLEIPTGDQRMVVFGWISNQSGESKVEISRSNGFNDSGAYEAVSGARVNIYKLDSGIPIVFVENGNSGTYYPEEEGFVGETGNQYQLFLATETDTVISVFEPLSATPQVDSVFLSYVVDTSRFQVDDDQNNYYLSALINDEQEVRNFYRWKIFVNGVLRNEPSELVLFDDFFTDGNRFRINANNVLFTKNDSVSFEQYSLSERAYDYYVNLKNQTDNSTILPNTKPSALDGNMRSLINTETKVYGYFGASEIKTFYLSR